MRRKIYFLLIVIAISVVIFIVKIKTVVPRPHITTRAVYLGAWVQDFWDNSSKRIQPQKLEAFENQIGKDVAIANYYQGWDEIDNKSLIDNLNIITKKGWLPMLSSNPYFSSECSQTTETLYKAIANGDCDQLLIAIAKNFKDFGKPLLFRFAWEMNIKDNSWGVYTTWGTPEDFVHAWQHFHTIVSNEGATNVQWVFSVNVKAPNSIEYSKLYPGDAYVDWTGLDGYNWGKSQSWSSWSTFDTVFHNSYLDMLKIAPSKPLMISEFNSSSTGGDKASWMDDMLSVQIPTNYPKISAIVFFDEDKTSKENIDWSLEKSPETIKVIRKALENPIYRSSF